MMSPTPHPDLSCQPKRILPQNVYSPGVKTSLLTSAPPSLVRSIYHALQQPSTNNEIAPEPSLSSSLKRKINLEDDDSVRNPFVRRLYTTLTHSSLIDITFLQAIAFTGLAGRRQRYLARHAPLPGVRRFFLDTTKSPPARPGCKSKRSMLCGRGVRLRVIRSEPRFPPIMPFRCPTLQRLPPTVRLHIGLHHR